MIDKILIEKKLRKIEEFLKEIEISLFMHMMV